ncbi:MAG TPA: TauD/TfdA family dioxygenase [Streptosporangiaceae bacterium]
MNAVPDLPALRGFAAIWLRSNCGCPACQDPVSGQRLTGITDVPVDVSIRSARLAGDLAQVVFGPDGHESVFSSAWLAAQRQPSGDDRCEGAKRLWVAADFAGRISQESWPRYRSAATAREECLARLLRYGFFLLQDVPCEPGTVLDVAGTLGYVRETNYGRLFDVRVETTPANLANTGLAIAPHTDNPYRDPVPTVQLLHCLATAVAGGDSGLVDGFGAAALLRGTDPVAFEILARTPVTFRYADATAELVATRPMIGLDPQGRIREIRFNNRSLQPVSPDGGGASGQAASFYAAYRKFAEVLSRPELMLTFRLGPGDCMVFDNTRILHARTAFAAAGRRHLQGCYADLDGVASTLAVLRR